MKEADQGKPPFIWLNGKFTYTAIISKDFVKENLGVTDLTDVGLESTELGLLIKRNDVNDD